MKSESPITTKRRKRLRNLLESHGAMKTGDMARAANVPVTSTYELLSQMQDVDSCIEGESRKWWLKDQSGKRVGGPL